jgi:hypothetical protein
MAHISSIFSSQFPSLKVHNVKSKVNSCNSFSFRPYAHKMRAQRLKFQAPDIYDLSGKSDVAITSKPFGETEWGLGVLIGIELKTVIDPADFTQAQIGCLLISSNSQFPALQVARLHCIVFQ